MQLCIIMLCQYSDSNISKPNISADLNINLFYLHHSISTYEGPPSSCYGGLRVFQCTTTRRRCAWRAVTSPTASTRSSNTTWRSTKWTSSCRCRSSVASTSRGNAARPPSPTQATPRRRSPTGETRTTPCGSTGAVWRRPPTRCARAERQSRACDRNSSAIATPTMTSRASTPVT